MSGVDVAVVGAGPAGVMAAAAARRAAPAARVMLVESSNRLGGSVTAAMHRSICGLYSDAPPIAADTLDNPVQRTFIKAMQARAPESVAPRRLGRAWVAEFPTPVWEASLAEVCRGANVDVRLESRVTGVRREADRLTAIEIRDETGASAPSWIGVRAVIDCTGGGHVLRLAGEDAFQTPDDPTARMLGGFAVRLDGLMGDPELLRLKAAYTLAKAVETAALPPLARFTTLYPGPGPGQGVCKLAIHPQAMGDAQAEAFARQVVAHLQRHTPEFAAVRLVEFSPRALPRDGLRLRGRYTVTEADVLQGRKHGAEAVHAWWPIERWDLERGPTYAYPPVGEHYDIPPGALHSAAIGNLFAAGACLSATGAAAASTRASGICLATGDAAGTLAATVLQRDPTSSTERAAHGGAPR